MSLNAHNFYYKNIPIKRLINKWPSDFNLTFLDKTEYPTFVYTGNENIKVPKRLMIKFGEKLAKKISKQGLRIYLYEPLCCYIKGKEKNKFFYTEFSADDDLSLIRSQELDSIQKLIDTYGFRNVSVFTCDYNVEKYLGPHYDFNISCKDLFLSDIKNSIRISNKEKTIEKHFWCAIGRYTYPRHLLISYLVNFSGNYTWHYKYNNGILEYDSWLEKENLDERVLSMLKEGNELLNDNYFYMDDKSVLRETVTSPDDVYIPNIDFNLGSTKFLDSYNNCFVAIVAETRFAQPTSNVSEKLLHCIGSRTPFILLAPPHTLEYIRSLGFVTFDKFWDEKYDTIENPTERLREIFLLIDKIGKMSKSDMDIMYQKMSNVLDHNASQLNKLD